MGKGLEQPKGVCTMPHHYRHILISGASSGIGAELARQLANDHVRLTLIARRAERLQLVANDCLAKGAEVTIRPADVRNHDHMTQIIEQADDQRPIDLIIANAGISGGSGNGIEPRRQLEKIFDINIDGVINTIYPAMDRMVDRGVGQIAIMSSLAGYIGQPTAPAYSASKACVKHLGEALHGNLGKFGLDVSVICPGFVKSELTDKNQFNMPFLLETDQAGEKIIAGLKKRKAIIAFPWPMRILVKIGQILPTSMVSWVSSRLYQKQPME
jgi:short-subunit dehydrogenase